MKNNFYSYLLAFLFSFAFVPNLMGNVNLDQGLVVYLPFNGNNNDFGPSNFNVHAENNPSPVADHMGNAAMARSMNGTNQNYLISNHASFRGMANFTLSVWFKTSTLKDMMLVSKHVSANDGEWYFGMLSNGSMRLAHVDGTNHRFNMDFPFAYNDNQWHHAVATFDNTKLEIFIDGVSIGSHNRIGGTRNTNHALNVGSYGGTENWRFTGDLDEVYIYNRALNLDEISTLGAQRSISVGTISAASICKGAEIDIPFTVIGDAFENDNIFTAYLSDKNGNVRERRVIGTIQGSTSGVINTTLPSDVASGTAYKILIMSSNAPMLSLGGNSENLSIDLIEHGVDLSSNLFGHFRFNGNIQDNSVYNRNMGVSGSYGYIEDPDSNENSAINLTGGHLNWGRPNEIIHNHGPANQLTISMWLKPTLSSNHWIPIANNYNNTHGGVYIGINPDSKGIRWRVNASGSVDAPGIPLNEWVHVTCVLSDGRLRIYYNGELKNDVNSGGGIAGINQDFLIGRLSSGTSEVHYRGGIDELHFFKRGLNDLEVKTLFHKGLAFYNPGICSGETIELSSVNIDDASYSWSGPDGFTSDLRNPQIDNSTSANAGIYTLTIEKNGCINEYTMPVRLNSELEDVSVDNNSPLCEGATVEVSAETLADVSYSWSGPNDFTSSQTTFSISDATTLASGDYTLTLTKGNCTLEKVVQVLVNEIPEMPVVGSNSPVCEQSTLELSTDEVVGATYNWTGVGGFNSQDRNPLRSSMAINHGGSYSLTVSVNGCESEPGEVEVVVNSVPNVSASNTGEYCDGDDIELSVTEINNATYSWSGPEGFSESGASLLIPDAASAQTGEYVVDVTFENTCTRSASTFVTVNTSPALPDIIVNNIICEGGNLDLHTNLEADSYSWTGPDEFTSGVQSPVLNEIGLEAGGTYRLVVYSGNCASEEASVSVAVNAKPATPQASSNSPVCIGGDLQLQMNEIPQAVYLWEGPEGFSSNDRMPELEEITSDRGGSYYASLIVGGCPSDAVEVLVIINNVDAGISGSDQICHGNTIELSANDIPDANYSWTGPDNFFSDQRSIVVENSTSEKEGEYRLIVTVDGCDGEDILYVTVNEIPDSPQAGHSGPVCEGNSMTLTATNVGNASYHWSGPNGYTSIQQNPVISSVEAAHLGSYHVRALVDGCYSLTSSVEPDITIIGNVDVAGNSPVCSGQALNLSTGLIVDASYAWSGPAGFTSNQQNPVISEVPVNGQGAYTVVVSKGSCSKEGSRFITVNESPEKPVITEHQFMSNVIESSAMVNNQWNRNGSPIANAVFPSLNLNNEGPGAYTVTVTRINGCSATSDPYNYLVATSISSGSPLNLGIYPNPSSDEIHFSVPMIGNGENTISLTNSEGVVVYRELANGGTERTINVQHLTPGFYVLSISSAEIRINEKLIISR
ncbi:MAG: LamG-like jellyroll fold domain-containing protein [Cytophagaceae bacterium]